MVAQNTRFKLIILAAAMILLVPFIAMQFTSEVNWTLMDFTVAGILLFGAGISCEFALRVITSYKARIIIIGSILFILLLIWAELAVGIFGTPLAGS